MKLPTTLDLEIKRMEELLSDLDSTDKEYRTALKHLEKLHDLKNKNHPKFKFEVDGNTIVLAGVNLLGIVLVLKHETLHAISSKAFGFILKPRI